MSFRRHWTRLLAAVALATALTGCGGGTNTASLGGGTSGTGVVQAPVTGFGSVFVRGIEFEVNADDIVVDGVRAPMGQADLAVGMLVTVKGSWDPATGRGSATEIRYDSDAVGPVTSVDVANGSFVALGNTIVVTNDTVLDDRVNGGSFTLDSLARGNRVEVSGVRVADDTIRATRVALLKEQPSGNEPLELKGVVRSLDTADMTFQLGSQVVGYSSAQLDAGIPREGQLVEAKGKLDGGVLQATKIEPVSESVGGTDGEEGELEGYLTSFTSFSQFAVNGQPVGTNGQTHFKGSAKADLQQAGVRIQVEGRFDADGVLQAKEVAVKLESDIRLSDTISRIDVSGPNSGTLTTRLGIEATVTPETSLRDDTGVDGPDFNLKKLHTGDRVEIRGVKNSTGGVAASRLQREDEEAGCSLRGPISGLDEAQSRFTILNVDVNAAEPGLPSSLNDGDVLEAGTGNDGDCSNSTLIAREVEAED